MRDRVSRASRYLAARLAMVRQSIQDGEIAPIKVPGVGHRADGFTKPLASEALRTFAAANLGMAVSGLVPLGRVRAPPGALHNGGYGGSFASRSGDTDGGDPRTRGTQRVAGRGNRSAGGDSARDSSGRGAADPPGQGTRGKDGGDLRPRGARHAAGRGNRNAEDTSGDTTRDDGVNAAAPPSGEVTQNEGQTGRRRWRGGRRQPGAAAATNGSNRTPGNVPSSGTAHP